MVLRQEYEDFKREMENINTLQAEQIVALLGKADILATVEEREKKYFSKRNSLGRQPLEPLQSFYCPITCEVMEDPVETPSGHSFERHAIEKWLSEGNDLCPITKTPLKVSGLRTNKTLRQSIEEWRDRNTMIFIGSMKSRIVSNDEEDVVASLGKLKDLCLERELHQEWMMMEDYLPVLVSLLATKNRKIRSRALVILGILATDHDERKENIAKTDDAIKLIVCSLARNIEESKLALHLLLVLSDNDMARNIIGNSQGCILLLVTISGSDDPQVASDAKKLLETLSFLHENIVQMAKVNYFGPLLHLLSSVCQSSSGLNIRNTLRKISSVQVLVQLCEHKNQNVQSNAVKLFSTLTKDGDDESFTEHVGVKCIETLVKIIKTSDDIEESVAATEIISNLPKNPQMTRGILDAGALQVIISILSNWFQKTELMIDSASGALCRFTHSTNQELQKEVAETGIIPIIIKLLDSGSTKTKQNIAISLKHFSENSNNLSIPVATKTSFFSCCISSPDTSCVVHGGTCTIKSSFCLIEANAIIPLAKVLDETDFGACEAALDALLTLVEGELLQKGSKVLESCDVIAKIVKLLSSPCVKLQEKALVALERIFRLVEYKQKYKRLAQMPLVEITQRGNSGMKSVAAKILAHLNVLNEQSSFF